MDGLHSQKKTLDTKEEFGSLQNVPFKPCILLTQNWINSLRERSTILLKKDEESIIQRNISHLKGITDIVSSGAKIMSSHGLEGKP